MNAARAFGLTKDPPIGTFTIENLPATLDVARAHDGIPTTTNGDWREPKLPHGLNNDSHPGWPPGFMSPPGGSDLNTESGRATTTWVV